MHNTPKEPIPPPSREKPLQKSMFLEHYPPHPPLHSNTSNTSQEQMGYNPLKRSLMENPGQSPNTSHQYQFKTHANPINVPNANTSYSNKNITANTLQPGQAQYTPFASI